MSREQPSPPVVSDGTGRYFSSAEDVASTGLSGPPDIAAAVLNNPHLGFLYLRPAQPRSSIQYDAYDLRVVTFQDVDMKDYSTVSADGVLCVREGAPCGGLVPLARWLQEHRCHRALRAIPLFRLHRKWKAFAAWRANVRARKTRGHRRALQERLFILNDALRPALIDIQQMCSRLTELSLCCVQTDRVYTLLEFTEAQSTQLTQVCVRLQQFRDLVKEVTLSACRTALLTTGHDMHYHQLIDTNRQHKMTYIEQINKRYHCGRLTCFIRLVDYLVINTMHVLMVSSVSSLLAVLQDKMHSGTTAPPAGGEEEHSLLAVLHDKMHSGTTAPPAGGEEEHSLLAVPQDEMHSGTTAPPVGGEEERRHCEDDDDKSVQSDSTSDSSPASITSMFITELMLDHHSLTYLPSEDHFQDTLSEIIGRFQQTVLSVGPLLPDSHFTSFTQPLIYDKVEERTCGDGPCLESMQKEDQHLQSIILNIKRAMQLSFEWANAYAESFERFRLFYQHNHTLDLDAMMLQEHDVGFFQVSLQRYHGQHRDTLDITPTMHLGLLLVDTAQLKHTLLPSPLRCLEAVKQTLHTQARRRLDSIISEARDAEFNLKLVPSVTSEYVNYLTFLDLIQDRMEEVEQEQEQVCQMYALMEAYGVAPPPVDLTLFSTLRASVGAGRGAMERALAHRELTLSGLCRCLQADVKELDAEVRRVKLTAQDGRLLEVGADRSKVRQLLAELQISIDELQALASSYICYQRTFKVEESRFEALEELSAEVSLKHLLWDALEEWECVHDAWMQSRFDQLDAEQLDVQVNKYESHVRRLEEGLPPNSVLACLKGHVEAMRDKLPVITDLRNPHLKAHHWEELESLVKSTLTEESMCLSALMELNVLSYRQDIQQVSGRASREASVETVIKQVEDSWKSTEFVLLPHRDSKNLFILGDTQNVQALLDDSISSIAAIAPSCGVGPNKLRVDEWQQQLTLCTHTLEEWLRCQDSWVFMENVFSSSDVQRRLPAEAKMFRQVDKSWKEVMRRVNLLPNALRSATEPGLLETFQNNNVLLEQIHKSLHENLDLQREPESSHTEAMMGD